MDLNITKYKNLIDTVSDSTWQQLTSIMFSVKSKNIHNYLKAYQNTLSF